jgi:hypothetical protein
LIFSRDSISQPSKEAAYPIDPKQLKPGLPKQNVDNSVTQSTLTLIRRASLDLQTKWLILKLQINDNHRQASILLQAQKKNCIEIDKKKVQFVPNPRPEVIGKEVRMKFQILDSDS